MKNELYEVATKRKTMPNELMKICKKCKTLKNNLDFQISGNKKWSRNECKSCIKIRSKQYNKTKEGLIKYMYRQEIYGSKKRNHHLPTYTKKEFKEWLYSQTKFHKLFDNWKRLDYQKDYIPSVDRKDDSIGYTMDNIQLMTWAENKVKADQDRISGKLITLQNKKVNQYSKNGYILAEYHSLKDAERGTGVSRTSISKVCKGELKTAGGYIWKFKGVKYV